MGRQRCVVCDTKGDKNNILTQHHYHWPRNHIWRSYSPEEYKFLRSFIQWVCHDCHTEYNNHYLHECHQLGCRECKFGIICRYRKGGVEDASRNGERDVLNLSQDTA